MLRHDIYILQFVDTNGSQPPKMNPFEDFMIFGRKSCGILKDGVFSIGANSTADEPSCNFVNKRCTCMNEAAMIGPPCIMARRICPLDRFTLAKNKPGWAEVRHGWTQGWYSQIGLWWLPFVLRWSSSLFLLYALLRFFLQGEATRCPLRFLVLASAPPPSIFPSHAPSLASHRSVSVDHRLAR
ncbi:uncharacterized protein LOC111268165 [Varroa jacobsoni]|uniref:uncharacterized protein LOC111268165 n=1 Tax=Varroa jacobsoni TaxID=62625 RepID=UPI000BF584D3|nr:uncharacterized protein LOC111268165 [Varroa jacobsoni]